MSSYSNSSYSAPVEGDDEDVDTSESEIVEETLNEGEDAQPGADEDGFGGDAPEPADKPVEGKRNPSLPTVNLSVPDAHS